MRSVPAMGASGGATGEVRFGVTLSAFRVK
jgi:hypothetical protein